MKHNGLGYDFGGLGSDDVSLRSKQVGVAKLRCEIIAVGFIVY